jgi:hypothetical protein
MTTIVIDNAKFDQISRALMEQLYGVTTRTGKAFGLSKSRQLAAQGLFGKPYEELKVTHLTDYPVNAQSGVNKVLILVYAQGSVLAVNGKEVAWSVQGMSESTPYKKLLELSVTLATKCDALVQKFHVPEMLDKQNITPTKIVELAKKMGYFAYENTLFDLIEDSATTILIDNAFCQYSLNGDWEGEVAGVAEAYFESLRCDESGPQCHPFDETIWYIEFANHEYAISFRELCMATPVDEKGNVWTLHTDGYSITISFKR